MRKAFPCCGHGLFSSQLASVILKQYVETHWCAHSEKFRPPETTERVSCPDSRRVGGRGRGGRQVAGAVDTLAKGLDVPGWQADGVRPQSAVFFF